MRTAVDPSLFRLFNIDGTDEWRRPRDTRESSLSPDKRHIALALAFGPHTADLYLREVFEGPKTGVCILKAHAAVAAALPHASRVELARIVRHLQEPADGFQQSSSDHGDHVFFAMGRGILANGIGSAAGIASVTSTSSRDPNGTVTIDADGAIKIVKIA